MLHSNQPQWRSSLFWYSFKNKTNFGFNKLNFLTEKLFYLMLIITQEITATLILSLSLSLYLKKNSFYFVWKWMFCWCVYVPSVCLTRIFTRFSLVPKDQTFVYNFKVFRHTDRHMLIVNWIAKCNRSTMTIVCKSTVKCTYAFCIWTSFTVVRLFSVSG